MSKKKIFKLEKYINRLSQNKKFHTYMSKEYHKIKKNIDREISKYYLNYNKKNKIELSKNCKFNFPFFEMGQINSKHLLNIDEMIIFAYYLKNFDKKKIVYDLGANIGLHSIILSKLVYKVNSFEPDPVHCKELKKNIKLNKCNNINLFKKAVSTSKKNVKFRIIENNSTGNHIDGDKKYIYGDTTVINVKTEKFLNIIKKANFIKIDIEGHERKIILSTKNNHWKKTDAFVEIGNKINSRDIFYHCKKIKLNIFSQMTGWKIVNKIKDMPRNYKQGSVFLTLKNEMRW